MGLRRQHLVAVAIFTVVAALRHLVAVASLRHRHCSRWSSPSLLLFVATGTAIAAAPLSLDQVSSSRPCFYC
ncbi:hypothetical protein B296_00015801 [Ensete ventricosum]|uniref:Uncharacterized protein n=1 Tax=Ensete ventricosum TaxID=4639 RepID=A0A427AU52_ENSVE|nr:hypothetical protein B296_00015801 [Ensete ventricosum]